jgi:hypothetical protein
MYLSTVETFVRNSKYSLEELGRGRFPDPHVHGDTILEKIKAYMLYEQENEGCPKWMPRGS